MLASLVLISIHLISAPLKVQVVLAEKPLANQRVEIIGFYEGEKKFEKQLKTNAQGLVEVAIESKSETHILAQTIYQNVAYYSGVLSSLSIPKAPVKISVYPVTVEEPTVHIEDLRLFITEKEDALRVEETIVIQNPSQKVMVGKQTDPQSEESPESFRFQLPPGAFDLKFDAGFTQETVRFDGNDIVLTRPILPGRTHLALQYSVERGRMSLNFQQEFSLPVSLVSLGASDSKLQLSGMNFTKGPSKWLNDEQAFTWTQQFVPPRKRVAFEMRGLGLQYRLAEVLGPLTLILLIGGLFFMRRLKRPEQSLSALDDSLSEWNRLHELYKRGLLTPDEFTARKLKSLEKLIPLMKNSNS